jgi:hypothetical protein
MLMARDGWSLTVERLSICWQRNGVAPIATGSTPSTVVASSARTAGTDHPAWGASISTSTSGPMPYILDEAAGILAKHPDVAVDLCFEQV